MEKPNRPSPSEEHRERIGSILGAVEGLLQALKDLQATSHTVPLLCNLLNGLHHLLCDGNLLICIAHIRILIETNRKESNKKAFLAADGVETLLAKLSADREGHILPYTAELLQTISYYGIRNLQSQLPFLTPRSRPGS